MLNLYRNIKFYRELRQMTQDELAKKTGYTNRSAVARIENGDIDLPQSKILLFAKALGVSPGDLIGGEGTIDDETLNIARRLLAYTELLNADGFSKLEERAEELTEVNKYRKDGDA